MGLLNGARDYTAIESKNEFDNQDKTKEMEEPLKKEEEEIASWEKKWMSKVDKTPTRDLSSLDEAVSGLELKDDGLIKRKGIKKEEAAKEETELDADGTAQAIKAKLLRQKLSLQEFWLRQLGLAVTGVVLAYVLITSGRVSNVFVSLNKGYSDDIFDEEPPTDGGEETVSVPLGGYLSLPAMILLMRLSLHYLFCTMGNTKMTLSSLLGDRPALPFYLKAMTMLPVLNNIDYLFLLKSVVEDAMVLAVFFVLSMASMDLLKAW